MGEKKSFPPKVFQQCTIRKVIQQLFNKDRVGPRRFLVADEVGLGKTIVAKHVINELRHRKGKKTIIYVSSSLDITKQNRVKLAENPDTEIVHADRINLLYAEGGLGRGLQVVSMTPGTSLNTRRSLGSAKERAYICSIIGPYFGKRKSSLARIFHGMTNLDNFRRQIDNSNPEYCPKKLREKICAGFKKIVLESGQFFEEALNAKDLTPSERSDLIKKVRRSMAETILADLNPDLVIFDEFQKFREITATDEVGGITHKLGRILLADRTPTLLLSATPYRLFVDDDMFSDGGRGSHYSDLRNTFTFITGSTKKAGNIVNSIQAYGAKIKDLDDSNVRATLKQKESIQNEVMKYMSRAERINFEGERESQVTEVFMGDKYQGADITRENILEYLRLAEHVVSKRILLKYWKSGAHPMSYLVDNYKLIEGAARKSETKGKSLRSDKMLYTKLKEHPGQHLKVKYLYDDLLSSGEAYKYLWLPPTVPYYPGAGIYSKDLVIKNGPKKGLIFSSLMFVPKMIAGELGAMRSPHFSRVASDKEIVPSGESWAKLFFPSTLLANSLSHNDFVQAKSHRELVNIAKAQIRKALSSEFTIVEKGKSLPAHQVLSHFEFSNDRDRRESYRAFLRSGKKVKGSEAADRGNYLDNGKLPIFPSNPELQVDDKTLKVLAETAVSSPSICFLRTINQLRKEDLSSEAWIELAKFCFYDVRSFVNRSGHFDAILKSGVGSKPLAKAVDYFKKGNFQSVVDEYLFQIFNNRSDSGVLELIKKLSQIFGPTKARCRIKVSRSKVDTVYNDIICCFGAGAEQSNSRDLNREAFNSPFWPMALATTSVGQEGLDFHLYCKDIYHWNLPTNPVAFEQREGRINRFNNFMIRQNIVSPHKLREEEFGRGRSLWDVYLQNAHREAKRTDRYNLEMSPNWIFTSKYSNGIKFSRHIMDLPCSNDRDVYKRLMKDLDLYRLALGQPNQKDFMEKLRSNTYYEKIDPRGVILNFFPHQLRDRDAEVKKRTDDPRELDILIEDCLDYLNEIKSERLYEYLKKEVERHVERVGLHLNGQLVRKSDFQASVKALYYFVDPFDDSSDRDPEVGFEDDLEVLKAS